ncbi:hypothetical protein Vadar_014478 [Vaccinium darrowii]|nr:hypothetical protein Vadar_014478 [Vaccinium darrowii]
MEDNPCVVCDNQRELHTSWTIVNPGRRFVALSQCSVQGFCMAGPIDMRKVYANHSWLLRIRKNMEEEISRRKKKEKLLWVALGTSWVLFAMFSQLILRAPSQDIDVPWLKSRSTPIVSKVSRKIKKAGVAMAAETTAAQVFPVTLDKVVRATVARPKKSRTTKEKDEEEEILVIEGIELGGLGRGSFVKFDVFINAEDETVIGPGNSEFAGSFVKLPCKHNSGDEKTSETCLRLGITQLLEDLGAEDDDEIVVAFVPRSGADHVTVGSAMIEFGS